MPEIVETVSAPEIPAPVTVWPATISEFAAASVTDEEAETAPLTIDVTGATADDEHSVMSETLSSEQYPAIVGVPGTFSGVSVAYTIVWRPSPELTSDRDVSALTVK